MAPSKVFSLEGRGLRLDSAADIEPHIKPLREDDYAEVEEVRFQGNTLGIDACKALAGVLETKKTLKVANLADIFTSRLLAEIPPALDALLQSLLALPNLHTVDLSDNAFGFNTIDPLRSFLSQHAPLQHLILSNNGLGPESGVVIATALTELAKKKEKNETMAENKEEGKTENGNVATPSSYPPLETIICGRNRLENGSMAAWAAAFTAHDQVRTVRLPQNGIRPVGLETLIRDGLANTKQLTLLDLQDNTMTSQGARALAASLPEWRKLKELGVGDCLLGPRGSEWVVKALGKGENETLEVLRLQYNEVRAKAVKDLADGLAKTPRLRRVELNGNQFDEEDEGLEDLRVELARRKDEKEKDYEGGAEEEDYWGLDDLDDLEEPDDEEDEEGDEADEEEDEDEDEAREDKKKDDVNLAAKIDKDLKATDEAEEQNFGQKKDKSVNDLADKLEKTGL